MRSLKKVLITSLIVILAFLSFALVNYRLTDDLRIEKILHQLEVFRSNYKQQKIYIHSDKDIYMAGEAIWLKAYLMDATSLLPDSVSKDIYIDLIDFRNKPVRTIILRNNKGFSNGDIIISDTLMEGKYQIRAYTNWMRNFDNDYFYHKSIEIKNPNYENIITTKRLKEIKYFNKQYRSFEEKNILTFFPEGGYLINGIQSKVAFKSENKLGFNVEIKGKILDDKGLEITSFESVHQGMGVFEFKPEKGRKYFAKISYESGKTSKFPLPLALETGISMLVDASKPDDIALTISGNRNISENIATNEVIVVCQSRGMVLYVSKGELKDKPLISHIQKKLFPTGIVQITVFDSRSEPQCERLVFISPDKNDVDNEVDLSKSIDDNEYTYTFELVKPNGNPLTGNFSLAVQEALENEQAVTENILTNLFLTSDLKGRIDNPSYYFNPKNTNVARDMDLLMLTHGWRRFVWSDLMANRFPSLFYKASEGIAIGGKITRDFFSIPIANSKVKMTVKDAYNDQFETVTDSHGNFLFQNLNYEDTINVKIEAYKPSGGKGVQIVIGDTVVPMISTKTNISPLRTDFPKERIKANNHKERMEFKRNYKGKPEPNNQDFKIHNTPNDVIYVKNAETYTSILQYMQGRVPGVTITGNSVVIRGVNTFYGNSDPLFLLDGVPIDKGMVINMNPMDIDIIEVLKGPECAIYGSRGANGVIAFYSKRGQFMKRGVIEFGMQGYYKSREFYSPNYASWSYKPVEYKVPRTIFWKPNIIPGPDGLATVTFKNKTDAEHFLITLEGITSSGELIHYKSAQ